MLAFARDQHPEWISADGQKWADGLFLFAFDPDVQEGFATNVNIIVAGGAGGADVDDLARRFPAELAKLKEAVASIKKPTPIRKKASAKS